MTRSSTSDHWTAYAALSDTGRHRLTNEDRWFADAQRGLYLVSDGIGGRRAGHVAAQAVVDFLPGELWKVLAEAQDDAAMLRAVCDAVCSLSRQILNEGRREPRLMGMGATLVGILVSDARGLVFHLGDSRLYRFRDQQLSQITKDHSVAQLLEDAGAISAIDGQEHPGRHQLTRFVGMIADPRPDARLLDLAEGDRLLLCTDGLTGMLTGPQISAILSQAIDPEYACQRLITEANAAGGTDNITALVIDC